jgi:hypothetical protein
LTSEIEKTQPCVGFFHGDPLRDRRRDAVEIRDGFGKVSQPHQQKALRSP